MKKLIMAAAIVCAAAVVQAATVTWSATAIAQAPSQVSASSYVAYLIDNDVAEYADLATAMNAVLTSGTQADGVIYKQSGLTLNTSNVLNLGTGAGKTLLADNDYAANDTINLMMIVFDADVGAQWYLGAEKANAKFNNSVNLTANFGTQGTNTWTEVVPEPTSGLLMLLGMGALALRRRRA